MAAKYLREAALLMARPIANENHIIVENRAKVFSSLFQLWVKKKKISANGVWKTLISINNSDYRSDKKSIGGVYQINVDVDIDNFLETVSNDKNKFLKYFSVQTKKIFNLIGIDESQIDEFVEFVIFNDFKAIYESKRVKFKDQSIQLVCIQGFENSKLFIYLFEKRKKLRELFVRNIGTNPFEIACYVNDPIWLSDNLIRIPVSFEDERDIDIDIDIDN